MPATRGWDAAQHAVDESDADGPPRKFVRLQDQGDKFVGAFVGEPLVRHVHWSERHNRYGDCDGDDCVVCANGGRAQTRATVNVFVTSLSSSTKKPDDKPAPVGEMKLFECSIVTLKSLLKVRDKFGFDEWLFEVERLGRRGDTKTSYAVLPEAKIPKALREKIAEATPHDLDPRPEPKPEAARPGPVEPELVDAIARRIKSLPDPKAAIEEFRAVFDVQKVRDLSAEAAEQVLKWLDRKEGGNGAAADDDI